MERTLVYMLARGGSRTAHQVFLTADFTSIHHHDYSVLLTAVGRPLNEVKELYENSILVAIGKAYPDVMNLLRDHLLSPGIEFDCEPNLVFLCKELNEIYPEFRKIHIIRHPKDWTGSILRWGGWVTKNPKAFPFEFPGEFEKWDEFEKNAWSYYALNNYIIDNAGISHTFKLERGWAPVFRHLNLAGFKARFNEVHVGYNGDKDDPVQPENWSIDQHRKFEKIQKKYQGKVPEYGDPSIPKLKKIALQIALERHKEANDE